MPLNKLPATSRAFFTAIIRVKFDTSLFELTRRSNSTTTTSDNTLISQPLYVPRINSNSPKFKNKQEVSTQKPAQFSQGNLKNVSHPPKKGWKPNGYSNHPKGKPIYHHYDRMPTYSRRIEGILNPLPSEHVLLKDVSHTMTHLVPKVSHGLDRVLFNPGVHWLQDPRSRVYNFVPSLQIIPDIKDFAFERLPAYIKSSQDNNLRSLAVLHGKRFTGSTSSLTGLLCHIYFLISGDHFVDTSSLSRSFLHEPTCFTPGQRMPVSVRFILQEGVYSIDSDHSEDYGREKNLLLWMGTMLEYYLTLPPDQFQHLLRTLSSTENKASAIKEKEAYRYSKTKNFILRAQLDSHDGRLPGSGIFDIKTRAVLPIRLDGLNYQENSGYLIRTLQGPLESFEKEYYDLIRSAFLKYTFQARIGGMDGIFLAYHNTARLFGFQYIPLEEMEERLFGGKNRGDRVFEKCIEMLEVVAEEIAVCFPGSSVSCTVETLQGTGLLRIWIEPILDATDQSDKDSGPIAQLNISAISYLDGRQVRGSRAVDDTTASWDLHWSISHASGSRSVMHKKLKAAKERQFRAFNLPAGISVDQIAELWTKLNFGSDQFSVDDITDEQIASVNTKKLFRTPNTSIKMLRDLARAGHQDTEKWANLEKDQEKIVWEQTDLENKLKSLANEEGDTIS